MGVAALDEARRLRTAVLCGGPSAEREVSLDSGRAVTAALREAGVPVECVELADATPGPLDGLDPDICFNALHGAFGEDGALQRLLDERGLAYTGSGAAACALAFDKTAAKDALAAAGVPTPAWTVVAPGTDAAAAVASAGLAGAVVTKPVRGGSSQGVTLVRERSALAAGVRCAQAYDGRVLIEQLIEGRELTVGVLDGEALPVIELATDRAFYDYEAKYLADDTRYLCPADLPTAVAARVTETALAACAAFGLQHFARVDCMLDADGTPWVLEGNAIPGFTGHSLLPKAAAAAGIAFPELCLRILALGWARHRQRTEGSVR